MTPTTPPPAKKPRKPRATKPQRTPRAVDPAIAALKQQFKRQMADYKAEQRSGKVLAKITAQLHKLTFGDKLLLAGALPALVSPATDNNPIQQA